MNSIESNFVPYQIALDMKSIGFDEHCLGWYQDNTLRLDINSNQSIKFHEHLGRFKGCFIAPTFSQCFRWFREKYGLYSWITMELGATLTFCWIVTGENKGTKHKAFFKSYKEAESACLLELINICKKK